jgi:hypothetical protein
MGAANTFAPRTDDPAASEDLYLETAEVQADRRSKLLKSYQKAGGRIAGARKVNPCKRLFGDDGCEKEDLDVNGYCKHLIGQTIPGDPKHYHPLKKRPSEIGTDFSFIDGSVTLPVLEGDELVNSTVCYRVYRRHPNQKAGKPKTED